MSFLLIKNGIVVDTEPTARVLPGADILVENDTIAAVGPGVAAHHSTAEILDAAGMIVLPGFVDTHRHTWQAAIRSTALDVDLSGYLDRVVRGYAPRFRPDDVYAGNLAGAVECLDGGITTLMDWSHIQLTPEHTDAALHGLTEAGLRAVFGYAHPSPADRRPDEVRRVLGAVRGLTGMALAAWGPVYGTMADTVADWALARDLGLRISVHIHGGDPIVDLAAAGLLGADTTYVHLNGVTAEAIKLIADSGGTASVTPLTEAQLGMGTADVAALRGAGVVTALGADAVASVPGDMFGHMRSILTFGSARVSPADVLRMATIDGAAATGLADRIGSLTPGKQADIIMVRADAPGVAPALDPIAALVGGAGPRDVDTVIVAGQLRKRSGQLLGHDLGRVLDLVSAAAEHILAAA